MSSATEQLARRWLDAFNARDVDAMAALYADDATHTSPKIREGRIVGRDALRAWWRGALERTPSLRYELVGIAASEDRVALEYVRHVDGEPAMSVCNVFDVADGRFVASRVYHG
ncbi:nuclear transport factor 2 family protein [Sandaracinus amylolyticus]|uniref:nuclear transport factor 2 family protein n=1 Tax=Sandaracinus amylolyticus TaxID=927083 RepID=UPI001F2CC3DD|nr:nuclear transport factor 2 family protein [Sandaracinus amylolyticus]